MNGPTRNTTVRDQHRRAIARSKPPCGICGTEIDYALKYPDLMAYVVDHIEPLGPDPTPERVAALDVLPNKQAAHNTCNRQKWDRPADFGKPVVFVTSRSW
jgi:hypothetical protein